MALLAAAPGPARTAGQDVKREEVLQLVYLALGVGAALFLAGVVLGICLAGG